MILVTDGEQRAAVAAVRSLARAGHRVCVGAMHRRSLAGVSRAASETAVLPDPLTEPERYADALVQTVVARQITVVLPITEASMLAALASRAALAPACIPFGSLDAFRLLSDKATLSKAAAAAGIAYPAEHVVAWGERPPADLSFPIVIKPSRSVGEADGVRTKHSVRYAADANTLATTLGSLPKAAFPVLLQEKIVGPGTGVFLLIWDDRIVARFAHRRIREKPPSGGVSVYAESIALDGPLVDASARLLRDVRWRGVAMVEYKRDAASGTPYLMEINGRFWGSLQLAIDAGVDFPALLVDAALGRRGDTPPPDYRVGVRGRWWWGDVDHLLARVRRGPSRGSAIGDFLRAGVPRRDNVWRASDPAPFLFESLLWMRGR